jgi:hypothetical protein
MIKNIEISPEIARLVQRQCWQKQLPFTQQLGRNIVEEAVMAEDPEKGLIVEAGSALADNTGLVRAAGVNDVVVSGKHVHVSVLDSEGKFSIPSVLASTRYLANGSLIVKMNGPVSGAVVGHISADALKQAIDRSDQNEVQIDFEAQPDFQFGNFMETLVFPKEAAGAQANLKAEDYLTFLRDRTKLPLEKQRQIISALLEPTIKENVSFIWQEDDLVDVLSEAAIWNSRVEKLCQALAVKFTSLSAQQIRDAVFKVGEKLGGQIELAEFQKALVSELTTAVCRKVSPEVQTQMKGLIDEVYSGASALKAVKQFIKNQLTIDLVETIDRQRKGLIDLANATADEFGLAFKTLALQPAYATHSPKENVSLEAVNEALMLLEVAKLAEEVKGLEF